MAEKNRYSTDELAEFDQLIDVKLKKANEELVYFRKQIEDLAASPESKAKSLGDGIGNVETERLYTLASRQRKLISHLENAKVRIINKTYGVCRDSGVLISKERLKAVPHATLSIKAKQKK